MTATLMKLRKDKDKDKDAGAIQAEFFDLIKEPQKILLQLFEHVSGVGFFMKDRESRLITGNQFLLDRLGLKSEVDLIGTYDCDYFPPEVCGCMLEDDKVLFETGEPIIGQIELSYNERGILDWYSTTKLPVFGHGGEVVGLFGLTYPTTKKGLLRPSSAYGEIEPAIELIQQNPDRRVSSEEMANVAKLSVSQLRRRFRQAFDMTPREFEQSSRILAAGQALIESNATITEIAIDFGFCDQSAFSVQFRKQIGCSPKEYRNLRNHNHEG